MYALGSQCHAQLLDRRVVRLIRPRYGAQRNIESIPSIDGDDGHRQREELIVAERLPHFLIDGVRDTVISNQRDGLRPEPRRAFPLAVEGALAPGIEQVQTLLVLTASPRVLDVHVQAVGTPVDL